MRLDDTWTRFGHNGRTYAARLESDCDHGAPRDEECGHGPVSGWTARDKRPGEFVLSEDRRGRAKRYYDFQAACRIARAERWDAPPYRTGTAKQRAARAALADFKHLRAWCNDEWRYVGVIVAPVCLCCDEIKADDSLSVWGIEDSATDYLAETALDLADELASLETCEPA